MKIKGSRRRSSSKSKMKFNELLHKLKLRKIPQHRCQPQNMDWRKAGTLPRLGNLYRRSLSRSHPHQHLHRFQLWPQLPCPSPSPRSCNKILRMTLTWAVVQTMSSAPVCTRKCLFQEHAQVSSTLHKLLILDTLATSTKSTTLRVSMS